MKLLGGLTMAVAMLVGIVGADDSGSGGNGRLTRDLSYDWDQAAGWRPQHATRHADRFRAGHGQPPTKRNLGLAPTTIKFTASRNTFDVLPKLN